MRTRLVALFVVIAQMALSNEAEKLTMRRYHLPPPFEPCYFGTNRPPDEVEAANVVQEFLRNEGVGFPPGSSFRYVRSPTRMDVFNTVSNHLRIGRVLADHNQIVSQFEVDVSFVAFPLKEIEAIARKSIRAHVSSRQILDMWSSGRGRLISAQKVLTTEGVAADLKSVDEIMSPAEPAGATSGQFETREAGTSLTVSAQRSTDAHTIELELSAQQSSLLSRSDVDSTVEERAQGKEATASGQPHVHAHSAATTILLEPDQTVVLGGAKDRKGEELIYLLVAAACVGADGIALPGNGPEGDRMIGHALPADAP